MYGGTFDRFSSNPAVAGLSPRVRGNRKKKVSHLIAERSIPACTGEPGYDAIRVRDSRVYPRVYGGTVGRGAGQQICGGLSPRVRGNHVRVNDPNRLQRSIPACTGEPGTGCRRQGGHWVYPRVYGGTRKMKLPKKKGGGLSPRVRGNRRQSRFSQATTGSIPACTGEPMPQGLVRHQPEVYPRVYGGTIICSLRR